MGWRGPRGQWRGGGATSPQGGVYWLAQGRQAVPCQPLPHPCVPDPTKDDTIASEPPRGAAPVRGQA